MKDSFAEKKKSGIYLREIIKEFQKHLKWKKVN